MLNSPKKTCPTYYKNIPNLIVLNCIFLRCNTLDMKDGYNIGRRHNHAIGGETKQTTIDTSCTKLNDNDIFLKLTTGISNINSRRRFHI